MNIDHFQTANIHQQNIFVPHIKEVVILALFLQLNILVSGYLLYQPEFTVKEGGQGTKKPRIFKNKCIQWWEHCHVKFSFFSLLFALIYVSKSKRVQIFQASMLTGHCTIKVMQLDPSFMTFKSPKLIGCILLSIMRIFQSSSCISIQMTVK